VDEEAPQLSAETFNALAEFYKEQEENEKVLEVGDVNVEIKEDWQLSQFWYSQETAETLARKVMELAGDGGKVACISAPTLYRQIKKINKDFNAKVFEFDKRFSAYGEDFIFFDYKNPLSIPRDLREHFDVVFADPPFLSEECLTKTAVTMKYVAKEKMVLCSGAVMGDLADRLLGLKLCKFEPQHQNNLANEFRCFANFHFDGL